MKELVCFIFVVSSCYCANKGYVIQRENGVYSKSQTHDGIERPCALQDLDCIRGVFSHNSDCKPVKGPVPDPYFLDSLSIQLSHANVTFILKDAQIRGLNDYKIKEFYINKRTDKLVLEVEFAAIAVFSPAALVRYHRKGKEPVELSDYTIVIYKDISLTLTVSNIKDLQLSAAHVYAYIPDSNPPYSVGAGMTDKTDSELSAVFDAMVQNIGVGLQEVFLYKGPAFMSVFLRSTICEFDKDEDLY